MSRGGDGSNAGLLGHRQTRGRERVRWTWITAPSSTLQATLSGGRAMRPPRMTTRMLIVMTMLTALSLALVLQHGRAARRERAMRADYEGRIAVALVELRDLRYRELVRLEDECERLRRESTGGDTGPRTDPR